MTSNKSTNHFSIEIESLRGVAALSVIIGHFYIFTHLTQDRRSSSGIISTLIAGLFDPQPAVLLFFTISGLVLGRQLRKQPVNSFLSFIAYLCRRLFRLIPLMWSAITFAFILEYCKGGHPGFSVFLSNITLNNISLDEPLWSLEVELYCSFFFPVLFFAFETLDKRLNSILFIALCGFSYFWHKPIFIQFFVFFHAGLLVDSISTNLKKAHIVNSLSLILFSLAFFLTPEFSIEPRNWLYGCWQSWVLPEILACSFILYSIINHDSWLNQFLRLSLVKYLGKISFSIYLFHFPLLSFMLVKINSSYSLQYLGISLSYFALVIMISVATYHFIELPTNQFGKILSSRLIQRKRGDLTEKLMKVPIS